MARQLWLRKVKILWRIGFEKWRCNTSVTIFEAPPLARALYGMVEVKQEIPQQLYKAVAQILAYVFQLRDSSITKPQKPLAPGYFDVPEQYRGEVI